MLYLSWQYITNLLFFNTVDKVSIGLEKSNVLITQGGLYLLQYVRQ